MQVQLADKYGFCFGVKRAIKIAEKTKNGITYGALIHNPKEIKRLKDDFGIDLSEDIDAIQSDREVIIRTHGIQKHEKEELLRRGISFQDATCPFVIKPQEIAAKMSEKGYSVVIFGDGKHPEIKGVKSYADKGDVYVVANCEELETLKLGKKVALISQTTKQIEEYSKVAKALLLKAYELRVFNTICNATFDNQDAARELSTKADIMIIVGGLNSANTRQLLLISQENCKDSYLIEDASMLDTAWFAGKRLCGISAGASTPTWVIEEVKRKIEGI